MKLYYYAAAFTALLLIYSGCMKQDYSDCPDSDNFILKFEMSDRSGTGYFTDNIKSIDALVFDDRNGLVTWQKVDEKGLQNFPGISLTLDPGDYRVVCWGNLDDNTQVKSTGAEGDFGSLYIENLSGSSSYPLFYAPEKEITDRTTPFTRAVDEPVDYSIYTVTVRPKETTTKELYFTRVYRNVRVYLKGYELTHESDIPQVRMNNMPRSYDFFLRTGPERRNYENECRSVDTETGSLLMASFDTPITELSSDMLVEILRGSDNGVVTTINLRQYVEENIIDDLNEISILVRYVLDGSVEITVPSWGSEPLIPGW